MRPTAVCLLPVAVSLAACAGAPRPPPLVSPPVAVVLPAPAPPPPPSEPEALAVVAAPPRVCELTRPLEQGPIELAVLPKVDVFGQIGAGVLTLGFGEPGAFAEVRSAGWTLRGIPSEEATRVSAARWIAFGGVLYASKRDRFTVAGTRNGKLVLPAPAVAGFTPAEAAATRETSCAEVSLVVDPEGALGRDAPAAFVPVKAAQTMVLRRSLPVPIAADIDGPAGGTIDADDTDVNVTLLERRGKRARVRMGHLAGWVDGSLVVRPPPAPPPRKKKSAEEAEAFGMIGLLSQSAEGESSASDAEHPAPPAPKAAEATPTTGSLVACTADVRLVVDWTSTGSIAASAGVTPTARRYVVGVVPAGKPLRVVEQGPELSTVMLGNGAFLPRGFARLTVPSRDIASGCAPFTPPEPTGKPAAKPPEPANDDADSPDAVDRLAIVTKDDAMTARGKMFGDTIGEAFGAGGLGLSGVGEGGGRGEGIGLGTIGSGGHGLGGGSTSAPRLREGAVQVTGRLPPEVIRRIVRQNFGRFRLCYENGRRGNPGLQGRVSTKFVIDRSGAVASVIDAGSDLPSSSTVSCVVRGFGNLSFPQPEGGLVTVVYPIVFSPP